MTYQEIESLAKSLSYRDKLHLYAVLRSINKHMSVQVRFCGQMCFGNKNEKNTFNLQSVWFSKLNINAYVITIL